ncbi:MAG: DSBA oxidoreductase [Parcubacteria group bacterium Gr01-1014_13]|nr:MAG: DSBA oxidoreductase [Parcubacteria group bacterium Gr01-1014_13]
MEPTDQNLSKKERHELRRQEKLAARESNEKKTKTTRILLWSFIVVFVAGTIGLIIMQSSKGPAAKFIGGTVKASDESDWIKGAPLKEAKVTLIEYSDFQCPACGAYYPMVKQLGQEFKNLTIVYRHFPLPQHGNAKIAAQAAEAAGQQGKFWEMHNMLFDNQNTWSSSNFAVETFNAYAQTLGLDIDKFKADFNSEKTKTKISADYESGSSEVDGTPTFFLNNKKIQNPQNYAEFRNIIQQAGGTL